MDLFKWSDTIFLCVLLWIELLFLSWIMEVNKMNGILINQATIDYSKFFHFIIYNLIHFIDLISIMLDNAY
jgi:hypothetical protein